MGKNTLNLSASIESPAVRLYHCLAKRAYSVIMFAALFCTLTIKLFLASKLNLIVQYPSWIYSEIALLLSAEMLLAYCCYRWNSRQVIRLVTILAAAFCTWSVTNAGWIIRTGTQIVPQVFLPLVREPLTAFTIIGTNLAKMPLAAFILLAPSAIALAFFFSVLAKPQNPDYKKKSFTRKVIITSIIILLALIGKITDLNCDKENITSVGLKFNSQLKATSILLSKALDHKERSEIMLNPKRSIPAAGDIALDSSGIRRSNIVIVVLEGVQYRLTSLSDPAADNTPYLKTIADAGVEFTDTHSVLTHTTKSLFGLMTSRAPSALQDISEAVPSQNTFASIASILKTQAGYRTAFFQSAKGTFESRPALISNLGFENFTAREDLDDPNAFIGYLGCDEFALIKPVTNWIQQSDQPFLVTIMCSITHDPYVVPEWYAKPDKQSFARYIQSIRYTDTFLKAIDDELKKLSLDDSTILCVISDHGEAFGEHGLSGHERIIFEESLRVPWVIRAPQLIKAGTTITKPASTIDLTATLLAMMGFKFASGSFDGLDALAPLPDDRKVYFSTWLDQGPAGYIQQNKKYIYDSITKSLLAYDLPADPLETNSLQLDGQTEKIKADIINWKESTYFKINQQPKGEKILFDKWQCQWDNRISSTKRID